MNSPTSDVRLNLGLLVACQAMLFTVNSTLIAINGLSGLALAPIPALATLPVTCWIIGAALTTKREAVKRFLWAYLKAEEDMIKNPALFAEAYSRYTGLPLDVTRESSKIIKLGGVINTEQVKLQAAAAFKQGIIQKDVTNEVAALYDDSLAREIKR